MDHSPVSLPSSDSSNKSNHSGYPPGTPKPPIDPPRRRSSLFFSRVVHHSHSPKTPLEDGEEDAGDQKREPKGVVPNIGQKRIQSPLTKTVVMPGHVAQMQRLFQHAKASLRFDVRFASSPVGSIDSRLPNSPDDTNRDIINVGPKSEERRDPALTPCKMWRYSRAPGFLAGIDADVREPFPDGSPQLPQMLSLDVDHGNVLVAEPPSSGFTSPAHRSTFDLEDNDPPPQSSPRLSEGIGNQSDECNKASTDELSPSDLEYPLTKLQMGDASDMDIDSMDESPIVSHLLRKSVEVDVNRRDSSAGANEKIVLSPSAKAAADSAKLKRGLYSELFPKPPTHRGSSAATTPSFNGSQQVENRCPDPLLHEGGPAVRCPDPTAHFVSNVANLAGHGGLVPLLHSSAGHHATAAAFRNTSMPLNRATATGSPMPLQKIRPPYFPPAATRQGLWYRPNDHSHHFQPHPRNHPHFNQAYIPPASEHFQPGWYYARDSPQPSPRPGPAMYSFSTAAAKVTGHDPAPDSMIRDSYRTDTLTPLAKPPSRFRKNGISAIASARTASKHNASPSYLSRPPQRSMWSTRSRMPENMQFRSSPQRPSNDSFRPREPKKRPRDLVSPTTEILEDETAEIDSVDPGLRLEEGEEMIEVDEETSAAVRMSLFGAATPETSSDAGGELKDLSPNVILYRKGTGRPGSRKKRRPSYWDGDLQEVVRSPAARHVISSPINKDDVRSLQADVEFDEEAEAENGWQTAKNSLTGVSIVAEGLAIQPKDVGMKCQVGGDSQYY